MARVSVINHKGISIVHIEIANANEAELKKVIDEAKPVIAKHAPGTAYTLTDLTGLETDSKVNILLKDFVAHNKPYVKSGAVIGLPAFKKVIFNTVMKLTGRSLHVCETIDEAKEWIFKNK